MRWQRFELFLCAQRSCHVFPSWPLLRRLQHFWRGPKISKLVENGVTMGGLLGVPPAGCRAPADANARSPYDCLMPAPEQLQGRKGAGKRADPQPSPCGHSATVTVFTCSRTLEARFSEMSDASRPLRNSMCEVRSNERTFDGLRAGSDFAAAYPRASSASGPDTLATINGSPAPARGGTGCAANRNG